MMPREFPGSSSATLRNACSASWYFFSVRLSLTKANQVSVEYGVASASGTCRKPQAGGTTKAKTTTGRIVTQEDRNQVWLGLASIVYSMRLPYPFPIGCTGGFCRGTCCIHLRSYDSSAVSAPCGDEYPLRQTLAAIPPLDQP